MFRDRYHLIAQRLSRNRLFERPVLPTDELRREYHKLTQIHSLRGRCFSLFRSVVCTLFRADVNRCSVGELKTVLGVLTQPEDNQFYLEDLTDSVAVDLSQVSALCSVLCADRCFCAFYSIYSLCALRSF